MQPHSQEILLLLLFGVWKEVSLEGPISVAIYLKQSPEMVR